MNNKRRDLIKKMTVSQQFVTQAEDNAKMDKVRRCSSDLAGYHDCDRRHFPEKLFLLGEHCKYYVPDVYSAGNFRWSELCPSSWKH